VITTDVKKLIVDRSERRPRNTLKLLQTVLNIGLGDEKSIIRAIEAEDVEDSNIADLCRAIQYKKPWNEVMSIYKKLDISTEATYYIMGSWFRASLEKAHSKKHHEALKYFIGDLPTVKPETYLVYSIFGAFEVYK